MEIKDFIKTTLVDLATGLQDADKAMGSSRRFRLRNIALQNRGHGNYGLVEFDLAVSAQEQKGKQAGGGFKISVLQANAGTKNDVSNSSTSRIKFVVEDQAS